MRRFLSFFVGVTIGGLVGGILSLLFTPMSGKEVREQIRSRAQSFTADIQQAANTKRIELQDRLEVLRTPKN